MRSDRPPHRADTIWRQRAHVRLVAALRQRGAHALVDLRVASVRAAGLAPAFERARGPALGALVGWMSIRDPNVWPRSVSGVIPTIVPSTGE